MDRDILILAPASFWSCKIVSPPLPMIAPTAAAGTKILKL